jgi:hypothetical protein
VLVTQKRKNCTYKPPLLRTQHLKVVVVRQGEGTEDFFTEATTNETLVMVAPGSGFTAHVCRYVLYICIKFDDDRVAVLAAVPVTSVLIEQDLAAVLVTAVLVKQNLKSSTSLNRG